MLSAEKGPIIAGFNAASQLGGSKRSSSDEEMRKATQRGSMRSPAAKSAVGEAPSPAINRASDHMRTLMTQVGPH